MGFGWVAADHGRAWTSDRDTASVELLDGVTPHARTDVSGDPPEKLAWAADRLFVDRGTGVDLLDPSSLRTVGRLETGQHPIALVPVNRSLLVLVQDRVLRYDQSSDRVDVRSLPGRSPTTALAIVDGGSAVVHAETCDRYAIG